MTIYQRTLARMLRIKHMGYNVQFIWEHDFVLKEEEEKKKYNNFYKFKLFSKERSKGNNMSREHKLPKSIRKLDVYNAYDDGNTNINVESECTGQPTENFEN